MTRPRLALSVATTLLIALLLAACTSDADDPIDPDVTNVPSGCTEVPIATSPEKFTLFTGLAETFNARGDEFAGECVAVTVYRVSSGAGARMLVRRLARPTDRPGRLPCSGPRPHRAGARSSTNVSPREAKLRSPTTSNGS